MPLIKTMIIFGTRPEAIKMAPVIKHLRKHNDVFDTTVVLTGQHRTMLDQMIEVFQIRPDYDLNIMTDDQTLSDITCRILVGLEKIITSVRPDLLLVQGDTTSTFIGALAGYYHRVKIGHIEAGLRTFDKYRPYPEEINRKLTSGLADLHFAPTAEAKNNLLQEGIPKKNIFITGNTVVDVVLSTIDENYRFNEAILNELISQNRKIVTITAHRRENWGEPFKNVALAVLEIADRYPDLEFVFPVHLNPNVQQAFGHFFGSHPRIHLLPTLDYRSFINLMKKSILILTDSGGIQEEAPTLRIPTLILRDVTERPEGLKTGFLKLVGCNKNNIVAEVTRLLANVNDQKAIASGENPYGDGKATQRIGYAILYYFGRIEQRPADFQPTLNLIRDAYKEA